MVETTARRERDRFRRNVAYLIVAVSIAGPIVSWRASQAAEEAGGIDGAAAQEVIRQQQAVVFTRSQLAQDLRLLGRAQESEVQARLLRRDAKDGPRVGSRAVQGAFDDLNGSALLRSFVLAGPGEDRGSGLLAYDPESTLRYFKDINPSSDVRLQPQATRQRAAEAHVRADRYVLVAALLVGSLFFFTLAQVTSPRRRGGFAVGGVVIAVISAVLFVLA